MAESAFRNIFQPENSVFVENLVKNCQKLFSDEDQRDDYIEKNLELGSEIEYSNTTIDRNQKFTCRLCNISNFESSSDQREHFQSDWHKFNLSKKSKKANFEPLNELEFENYVSDGESSSSDDEQQECSKNSERQILQKLNTTGRSFFVTDDDQVFSCYKAILDDSGFLDRSLQNSKWTIIALAGGHFAAAYFEKEKCVLHKTLHRYVVRAKQGGAQGARDGKQSQNKPKSAGANFRRYNESVLCKDIEDFLQEWSDNIQKSNLIFLRYPSYYKKLFFRSGPSCNEKLCKLDKSDPRVRNIPFNSKKPTLQELERIHRKLSCLTLHGSKDQFLENLKVEIPAEPKTSTHNVEKVKTSTKIRKIDAEKSSSDENDDNESVNKAANRRQKVKNVNKSLNRLNDDVIGNETPKSRSLTDDQVRNLYTCLKLGDCDRLKLIIDQMLDQGVPKNSIVDYLNEPFSIKNLSKTTHLHSVCANGFTEMLQFLLNFGCDPTILDSENRTPYSVSTSKNVREILENFRRNNQSENVTDFDWSKSQIPIREKMVENLPISEEEMEKIRQKKKAKAEKQKQKKQEKQALERELEEKRRFLALSDREKRALAAEKRLLASCQEKPPILSRCFQCATDITGQIPFEYSNFVFCTTKCLNLHRKTNTG